MTSPSILLAAIGAVAGLLALSAFFSSSESAIFSLPEQWVESAAADPSQAGDRLAALRADPHRLLVTILVGNNLVNIAITSIVTVVVARSVPPGLAVVVTTVSVSVTVLVVGEIVPKAYGLGHAEEWALRVAGPLSIVASLLAPIVVGFDIVTRWLTAVVGGDEHIEDAYLEE